MTKGFCNRHAVSWIFVVALIAMSIADASAESAAHRHQKKQLAMVHSEYLYAIPLKDWFSQFDKIRQEAELSIDEHAYANALLLKVMSGSFSSNERRSSELLLGAMIDRYRAASNKLRQLPKRSEGEVLQTGFAAYFSSAAQLASDCLRAQKTGSSNGTYHSIDGRIVGLLVERKRMLDELQMNCLIADGLTRVKFGIPNYDAR